MGESVRPCWFEGCGRPQRARGHCNGHLEQQRRGKPMTPLRMLPRFAWTYVVYWPDALGPGLGVLKIGRAWSRWRVKRMVDRGAWLVSNIGGTDESWERWALRLLALQYPRAFQSANQATDLIYRGHGWTECFAVAEDEVYEAMDVCIRGYSYGNDRGRNDPSDYLPCARSTATPETESDRDDALVHSDADSPDRQEVQHVHPVNAEAMVTARALWLMTDPDGRLKIDVDALAAKVYPLDDPAAAADRVELHVILLEDAGFLTTDGEWIHVLRPLPDPAMAGFSASDSTPSGREREGARVRERESERMSACESRARASVRAERERVLRDWERRREQQTRPSAPKPRRPASLDAPPLGCPDHPHGSLSPCGPCGTARRQYDAFIDEQVHAERLATWEFWHGTETTAEDETEGEVPGDDEEPF